MLRVATTTDAGRHWDLRHLPRPAARLIRSANFYCPRSGCLDLVSARTWVVGAGHDLYTTTDAGLSWRASSHGPQQPLGPGFNQPAARFPRPEGGLGLVRGRLGPPMAYDRRRAALVDIFSGRPLSHGWWED